MEQLAGTTLSDRQLERLTTIFSLGGESASQAMSKWLRSDVVLKTEEVRQCKPYEATSLLGPPEDLITACVLNLEGGIEGKLVLAFDDESGLALTDLLLGRPSGTAQEWTAIEESAAAETANILGCAYLNELSRQISTGTGNDEIVPSPPELQHDYASCMIESLLMEQMIASEDVLVIVTELTRNTAKLSWHMLLLPEPESFARLASNMK
ncbi:chemotaxis protein CheC [bacterium]|nr:chemotaxis protein CheC [bacterium]